MIGPVFRVLELARERAGQLESREGDRMGRRFELFVRELLALGFPQDQIVAEHMLDGDQSRHSPDTILFEPDSAILIQTKIKRLSRDSFFGFSFESFQRDAKKAMAETISKSIKYLAWLDTAKAERTLTDEARGVRTRLRATKRIFLLGVVPAMPSVFHLEIFRKEVWSGIVSLLRDDEKKWCAQNGNRISGWHIVDSEEIAVFMGKRKGLGLHEALAEYVQLAAKASLTEDSLPASFSGHVSERGRRLGIDIALPAIDEGVLRFHDWMLGFTFQKTRADYEGLI